MKSQPEYWNIDENAGAVLEALIHTHQPQEILEVGTSNGYSAIRMGKVASQYGGRITTIEFFDERIALARANAEQEGLSESITVLKGDAMEILPRLSGEGRKFQFIFLDANKEEYVLYFHYSMQMVEPGGLIIADNTLSHRKKLDAFFEVVHQEPRAQALELSIGTGLMVIRIE